MHYAAFYNAQDCLTTKDHPVWDVIAGVQHPARGKAKALLGILLRAWPWFQPLKKEMMLIFFLHLLWDHMRGREQLEHNRIQALLYPLAKYSSPGSINFPNTARIG